MPLATWTALRRALTPGAPLSSSATTASPASIVTVPVEAGVVHGVAPTLINVAINNGLPLVAVATRDAPATP